MDYYEKQTQILTLANFKIADEDDRKQMIRDHIEKMGYEESNERIAKFFEINTKKVSAIRSHMIRKANNAYAEPKKARDFIKKESFKNSKGDKKEVARNAMIAAIMGSKLDTGKILSLPFHECLIERKMGRNRFEYIGCERERDTYFEMLKTIGEHKLNITPYLGSIQDKLIIAEKDEYSHLILDYCGQISTFQDEIELAIMNNIVKVNGTISVTLCKRGSIDGKIGEKMNSISESFYQTDCLHTMSVKLFFSQFAGENYKIETFMEYKDSMPMVLIILKRIK